ncbi:MAG: hypothetical protein K6U74_15925 [Firmicutes bacterium]|nr:hypothetical protein [Bacillota bacterium]
MSSGAHFFATHYRSFRAWAVTAGWSVLAAFLAMFIFSSPLGILLTLLFFTGFIPLWAANLRVFHALFFVLVYLLALFLAGPRDYFSWPLWVAAAGMAVIPEMLALLYPERMYRLDSLPVITPTLTFGQKLRAVVEIFFLLIDFYALAMEKYIWLKKLTFLGKYLVAAGIILEVAPFFVKDFFLPLFFSLLPFAAGSLLLLAAAEYGATGAALAVYGLAAGVARGLIFTAILLLILGIVLFFGRPRETKQERARWKGLNET